jgi:F0F1-type ATP synthase assembly protein I
VSRLFKDPSHRKYIKYLSLGAELAIALSAPILLGYWLDLRWDTSPAMLLAGILLGLVFMIRIFMKVIRNMNEKQPGK